MVVPKKVVARLSKEVPRFQKVVSEARDRNVNESDTVAIVRNILDNVFGFDRFTEVTSEFIVQHTYIDLAVKIGESLKFLVEVKAIGLELKESDIKKAVMFGASNKAELVVLTNGILWQFYKIRLDKSVQQERILSVDFLKLSGRKKGDQEQLYLFCREGFNKSAYAIDVYYKRRQSFNRYIISAILLDEKQLASFKRNLRKISPGLKVNADEIERLIVNKILKQDLVDSEEFKKARRRVRQALNNSSKKSD